MRCSSCSWVLPIELGLVFEDGDETAVDPVRAALFRTMMSSLKIVFTCPVCQTRDFLVSVPVDGN